MGDVGVLSGGGPVERALEFPGQRPVAALRRIGADDERAGCHAWHFRFRALTPCTRRRGGQLRASWAGMADRLQKSATRSQDEQQTAAG